MEFMSFTEQRLSRSGKRRLRYGLFRCPRCGEVSEKMVSDGKKQKTCGCLKQFMVSHGHALVPGTKKQTPLFQVWSAMKSRCYSPANVYFRRYGGRGIYICSEWLNSPASFFLWCESNGWEKGLHIDRIDNDGPYGPENCQFISCRDNNRKRSSVKLTVVDAIKIRKLRSEGISCKRLSNDYNVCSSTINAVVSNRTWKINDTDLEVPTCNPTTR